ncbi:MAG: hypothetical protein ACWA6Y_10300 [Polaromonas sp.]
MSDIEDLERKKRELELRRDIAQLERNERIADGSAKLAAVPLKTGGWSWGKIAACTIVGALFLILADGTTISYVIGFLLMLPLVFKVFRSL